MRNKDNSSLLKTVHHYTTTLKGGAGIAAQRNIEQAMQIPNIEHVVFSSDSNDTKAFNQLEVKPNLHIIKWSLWAKFKRFYAKVLNKLFIKKNKFAEVFGYLVGPIKLRQKADIHHLHWITNFLDLPRSIQKDAFYVWSLHDLAPLTGGCHYFWDCHEYQNSCSNCPQVHLSKILKKPSHNLKQKIQAFQRLNAKLVIIATSEFSYQAALKSALVKSSPNIQVKKIPYGIDTDAFFPEDKIEAKKVLDLPLDKLIVCFGAVNLTHYRKGGDLLLKLAQGLHEFKDQVHIVTFGSAQADMDLADISSSHFGPIDSLKKMRSLYSSSDLFLALSRQEAFGQTCLESLACSTPVIAFKETGFAEQIIDGKNGYLIEMENTHKIVEIIKTLLTERAILTQLQNAAREHVIENFSQRKIIQEYQNLYHELLN